MTEPAPPESSEPPGPPAPLFPGGDPPLGRRPPRPPEERPRLALAPFLDYRTLPPLPESVDYLAAVGDDNWPMYLNDEYGDCTVAAEAHQLEAWAAASSAGRRVVRVSDADVLAAYSRVSGFDPVTGAHDDGAVMQDTLEDWQRHGLGGHKILAFAEVNVRDLAEVYAALAIFGQLYVGLNVTRSAVDQFNAGSPWDTVPDDDGGVLGGHAVNVGAAWREFRRDADGLVRPFKLVTWGRVVAMTPTFWTRYVEEAWVAVSPEWLDSATGRSPAGLDLYALGEALRELTRRPNPFPAPAPEPPPAPPAPPAPSPDPWHELRRDLRAWARSLEHLLAELKDVLERHAGR